MGLLSFIHPSSVSMSEVPSTPRRDLLREHRKTLSLPPAPTPAHCYGQKFLSQRLLSFSFFPSRFFDPANTPSKRKEH